MGGPKDTIPPKVVRETPKNLTRNFKQKEIQIQFNEFFKLNNEFKEFSISPAMEQLPILKVKRAVLDIKFQDTLAKNTTYTLNFGNAIVDYNEGNVLKNYSYVFSTGNVIDSLTLSGRVINALTKRPEKEATVFIIPVSQDTIFGKRRASIYTITDSSGNFNLTHLHENTYRVYALKEEGGGDRIFNSTNEGIGFLNDSIVLNKNVANLQLEVFKEEPLVFRTIDRKIDNDGRILLHFNKSIEKPDILITPETYNRNKFVEFSRYADSAMIWLPDMKFDSIAVIPRNGTTNLDTITIRRNQRETYNQTITVTDNLLEGTLKQRSDLVLTFTAPVTAFDASKIKLLEDSVARKPEILKDTSSFRKYSIRYRWRPRKDYVLDLGAGAFSNSFGGKSKAYLRRFTLQGEEDNASLILNVTVPDTSKNYIVQLLRPGANEGETEILRSDITKVSRTINYTNFPAGTYTIRVVYDQNNNNRWDTGNVLQRRQPEPVWNYEKEVTLRANWEQEEKITIPERPAD